MMNFKPFGFNPFLGFMGGYNGLWFGSFGFVVLVIIVWSLVWKGLALWKAARQNSKAWFVVLLILNTLGILEILYLYVFSKRFENQKDDVQSL